MQTTAKIKKVKFPDCNSEKIFYAFLDRLRKTQDLIIVEIRKLASDDKNEVDRIKRVFTKMLIKGARESDLEDLVNKEVNEMYLLNDKEPSITECYLSMALAECSICLDSLEKGDLSEAFNLLCDAGEYLGAAKSQLMSEEEKKIRLQYAAYKRHEENRAMKTQAVKHYIDNHQTFSNKDDAALKISKGIVPVAFSTVRGWLKGVKPKPE